MGGPWSRKPSSLTAVVRGAISALGSGISLPGARLPNPNACAAFRDRRQRPCGGWPPIVYPGGKKNRYRRTGRKGGSVSDEQAGKQRTDEDDGSAPEIPPSSPMDARLERPGGRAGDAAGKREEHQRTEARYRAAIGALTLGVALFEAVEGGEEFIILDVNRAGAELVHATPEALIGRALRHVLSSPGGQELHALARKTYQAGGSHDFPPVHHEDSRGSIWISARLTRLEGGEILGVFEDVTDIQESRRKLATAEAWFGRAAEDNPDAIIALDGAHRVIYGNQAAAKLFGRPLNALMGEPFGHPLVYRSGTEVDIFRPDGTTRTGEVRTSKTLWKQQEVTVVTLRDVTALKEAQARLAASERKLKSILDHVHFGIALLDRDYRVLEVNRQMTDWFGQPDTMVGQICSVRFRDPGHEMPCEGCPVAATLSDGQLHQSTMERWMTGKPTTFRVLSSPVKDENGEVTSVIEILEDITETRLLEAQLRQAQKMEAVGRLAGGVAHDFNNLLTIIGAHADFIESALPQGDRVLEDLDQIRRASDRATSLTRQLLAFSRRQPMRPTVLNLNSVLEEMGRMVTRVIGEDIRVEFRLTPALWPVEADQAQIEQVVMNLVVNARDAMPSGGRMVLETANVTVDEAQARRRPPMPPGRFVLLAVSDTGCGMDAETRGRVFEPFFTTKKESGTGLGLSTVYGIVKQNRGFVWVDSDPGRGSEFQVYLPAVDKEVTTSREMTTQPVSNHGGGTILLAEDDDLVRRLAKRIMERAGYRVLEASSGEDALSVAADHDGPIHLLVTDVVMPGMNGRELAERLCASMPDMEVLFTSGYTADMIAQQGALDPGIRLVEKPFDRKGLLKAIESALHGRG